MIPLTTITWKLGELNTTEFEQLLPPESKREIIVSSLSHQYNGVYFLVTCQRIIIVIKSETNQVAENCVEDYFAILEKPELPFPEIYQGNNALYHLAEVVSSLDSIVIGETEIQGQFRDAYNTCKDYMGSFLINIISKIIRTGKRIRQNELLKEGQISTITLVEEIYREEFNTAKSIGVIGTGKMAKGIIRHLIDKYENIVMYTKSPQRVGEKYKGVSINHINELNTHDILITATDTLVIDKRKLQELTLSKSILAIDLGIPRNCSPDIDEHEQVTLTDMEKLVQISKNPENKVSLNPIYDDLKNEVNQILTDYRKEQKKEIVISLRKEMLKLASSQKDTLIDDPKNEIKFDQFINKLVHVSQKHLEQALLG